ncbi:MAG: glycosyltransferase [Dehalococcoidia bacterium]|nr:glycosyltransferase [Dehalococcoidia bacterium]
MNPLIIAVASVPPAVVLAHGAWWSLLSLVALKRPAAIDVPGGEGLRLAVVVPAHNEELLIGACVDSLRAAAYERVPEVIVVADNCTDATAAIAREHGATVLERTSETERGKNYALDFALAELRARAEPPDAVVIVDADTTVSPGLYRALGGALAGGAQAVQAHYAAAGGEGDLVALRRLALSLVHWSRPLGAARLGLGSGLKGNGMAFAWPLVRDGFGGSGITEDAAFTVELARRGVAVRFTPGATVWGHMAATYDAASVQDRRWEGGRLALMPRALGAAATALARGNVAAAAGAVEVASLPLTLLGALAAGGVMLAVAGAAPWPLAAGAAGSLAFATVTGLAAARPAKSDLAALRTAPRFVAHKLGVYAGLAARRPVEWQRTGRG